MTIRAVRGDKFLRMADFRGPTFAYRLPLWRDVRNAIFPSFPDAPGGEERFCHPYGLTVSPPPLPSQPHPERDHHRTRQGEPGSGVLPGAFTLPNTPISSVGPRSRGTICPGC